MKASGFSIGLLLGAAAGTAIAMVLSSDKGKDLLSDFKNATGHAGKDFKKAATKAGGEFKQVFNEAGKELKQVVGFAKEKKDEVVSKGKQIVKPDLSE